MQQKPKTLFPYQMNFNPLSFDDFIEYIQVSIASFNTYQYRKKMRFINVSCSYDTEVSSFYVNKEKQASCYAFIVGFNGQTCLMRTWSEFENFIFIMNDILKTLDETNETYLLMYVHNLSYEFQFMRKHFEWNKVFALHEREVVECITGNIIFRCSYILSGYSLKKVGEHLTKYKVEKLTGDLDYSKLRLSNTPLSQKEIGYIVNDAMVVMSYIQELIERDGNISRIPLTKTSYVRRYVRDVCFYGETGKSHKGKGKIFNGYHELMNNLTISSVAEYYQLKRVFQGGFTHASWTKANTILYNLISMDFTSSYPYVCVSEQFPMSRAECIVIKTKEELWYNLKHYCCMFDVRFIGLESSFFYEHYLSYSKCWNVEGASVDNGRIIEARSLNTSLTEQDFMIMYKTYKWKECKIYNFRRYRKGYLPKPIIMAILNLYKDKTELKNVPGKEVEYLSSKENVNSVYGMMVTDIIQEVILYQNQTWSKANDPDENEVVKLIQKYNNSIQRFLFYPWGVWITAYARRNLWTAILELKEDYGYSDTDSVKFMNYDKHKAYFDDYNDKVIIKLKRTCKHHGIDFEMMSPKTIKGIEKTLGLWDHDASYKEFKTLGAKRYMYRYTDGKLGLTISGVNKEKAIPYLIKTYGDSNVLANFSDGLNFPPEATGKNVHTYIDDGCIGEVVDYLGNKGEYEEKSFIHMEGASYSLSLTDAYFNLINGYREVMY